MSDPGAANGSLTPFLEIDRRDWAALAPSLPLTLDEDDIQRLRGLGDALDLTEVSEVYLPLSRLLNLYVAGARATREATAAFLHQDPEHTPFVIGVAGSVAVGKSTISRLLRELLSPLGRHPERRADHDRRIPLAERRAGEARAARSARASRRATTAGR